MKLSALPRGLLPSFSEKNHPVIGCFCTSLFWNTKTEYECL